MLIFFFSHILLFFFYFFKKNGLFYIFLWSVCACLLAVVNFINIYFKLALFFARHVNNAIFCILVFFLFSITQFIVFDFNFNRSFHPYFFLILKCARIHILLWHLPVFFSFLFSADKFFLSNSNDTFHYTSTIYHFQSMRVQFFFLFLNHF